jgi:ribosomal protein L24
MATTAQFRIHQTARVVAGKYAGTVGTVVEVTPQRVRVHIEGIFNGEPVNVSPWLAPSALEVV